MNLECTTTVYSYGTRILETLQDLPRVKKSDSRYSYAVNMVNGFFNTYLNGLRDMSEESVKSAISHLRLMQTFSVSKTTQDSTDYDSEPPILCITFELDVGDGSVQLFSVNPA